GTPGDRNPGGGAVPSRRRGAGDPHAHLSHGRVAPDGLRDRGRTSHRHLGGGGTGSGADRVTPLAMLSRCSYNPVRNDTPFLQKSSPWKSRSIMIPCGRNTDVSSSN